MIYNVEKILDKYYIYKIGKVALYPEEGDKKWYLCKIKQKNFYSPLSWKMFFDHPRGTTFYTFSSEKKAQEFIKHLD
jgi:hypothetical protein